MRKQKREKIKTEKKEKRNKEKGKKKWQNREQKIGFLNKNKEAFKKKKLFFLQVINKKTNCVVGCAMI